MQICRDILITFMTFVTFMKHGNVIFDILDHACVDNVIHPKALPGSVLHFEHWIKVKKVNWFMNVYSIAPNLTNWNWKKWPCCCWIYTRPGLTLSLELLTELTILKGFNEEIYSSVQINFIYHNVDHLACIGHPALPANQEISPHSKTHIVNINFAKTDSEHTSKYKTWWI